MLKGQWILIFLLFGWLSTGCRQDISTPQNFLVIFIEDAQFEELSCQGALTSNPYSGLKTLCDQGAIEFEVKIQPESTAKLIQTWVAPNKQSVPAFLYSRGWSTFFYPSSPEFLTPSSVFSGFENIYDQFQIKNSRWATDGSTLLSALSNADKNLSESNPKYQLLVISDLSKIGITKDIKRGVEIAPNREAIWEALDTDLYYLFSNKDVQSNNSNTSIIIVGISESQTLNSAIFLPINPSTVKKSRSIVSFLDLSKQFHSQFLDIPQSLFSSSQDSDDSFIPPSNKIKDRAQLIYKIRSQVALSPSEIKMLPDCFISRSCNDFKNIQRLFKNLKAKKDHRRISQFKMALEGFYLNEVYNNPLKVSTEERDRGLLATLAFFEVFQN